MRCYGESYESLDRGWPWKRVLFFYERTRHALFEQAFPSFSLQATVINALGGKVRNVVEIMPSFLVPPAIKRASYGTARYTSEFVADFELALSLGLVSNGALAALDVGDLRASGWET